MPSRVCGPNISGSFGDILLSDLPFRYGWYTVEHNMTLGTSASWQVVTTWGDRSRYGNDLIESDDHQAGPPIYTRLSDSFPVGSSSWNGQRMVLFAEQNSSTSPNRRFMRLITNSTRLNTLINGGDFTVFMTTMRPETTQATNMVNWHISGSTQPQANLGYTAGPGGQAIFGLTDNVGTSQSVQSVPSFPSFVGFCRTFASSSGGIRKGAAFTLYTSVGTGYDMETVTTAGSNPQWNLSGSNMQMWIGSTEKLGVQAQGAIMDMMIFTGSLSLSDFLYYRDYALAKFGANVPDNIPEIINT
jgi:hypothetical protein